jgi:glycosyltransferase involved in cell wall biosynthesis
VFPRDTADWQDEAAKADVLITHLDNTSTVISAALLYKKPLVQVLHNTHPATKMWASCKHDLIVYNSEWMRNTLGASNKTIVVRPPVRFADYHVERPRATAVTLINLNQAKGGVLFAQLAAVLPAVQFLGVEGAYGEQINVDLPNVAIVKHGTNMRKIYSDTKLLLMPSTYESWGRVGVEAMCSGIPVLAHPTPGLRESLGPGGRFVPPPGDGRVANVYMWKQYVQGLLGNESHYKIVSEIAIEHARKICALTEGDLEVFCTRVEALA